MDNRIPPYARREETYGGMCRDVLFCVVALCIFSCAYFGWQPLWLTLGAIAVSALTEAVCCGLRRHPLTIWDGSAVVTGALIGLLMSPIAPFWMVAVAAVFAVAVVKMPFGGRGGNLFNPAAAGIALVTVLFPTQMFSYPAIDAVLTAEDVVTELSPAALLKAGGTTALTWTDFLFGQFPGPIGATPILILCGCGAYLLIRRAGSPLVLGSYLATCALIAALFPRIDVGAGQSVLLELCSGYLLFAGVFLLQDPVTSPAHWLGRIAYGVLAGVLVMLMRHIGRFEEGACFAILLCNTVSYAIDRGSWKLCAWMRRQRGRDAL